MNATSRLLAVGLFSICYTAAACGSSGEPQSVDTESDATKLNASQLDVNDIGGILGRDSAGSVFPKLSMSTFVSDAVFKSAVAFGRKVSVPGLAGTQSIDFSGGVDLAANWYITAWRFDPCATSRSDLESHGGNTSLGKLAKLPATTAAEAKLGQKVLDADTCDVQLRLIGQPVIDGADLDYSVHLVFSFGKQDKLLKRDAALRELIKLKALALAEGVTTTGAPLGVHPALTAGNKKFAAALSTFLKSRLKPEQLNAMSFMGIESAGSEPWAFYAGVVSSAGAKWDPIVIPSFASDAAGAAKGAKVQTFRQTAPVGVFPKQPGGTHTASLMEDRVPLEDAAAELRVREQRVALANQVNNPDKVNFFTTDCVSCHTSTQRIVAEALPLIGDNLYLPPKGLMAFAAATETQGSTWNLHNLGYFLGAPAVSYRTVFETAEGADAINRFILPFLGTTFVAGRNPGNDCSDPKVYQCFMREAQAFGSSEECPKQCKGAPPVEPDPNAGGNLPTLASLAVCQNRELATRPNLESGNSPVTLIDSPSKRLGLSLSVNDSTCMSRVFNGNFASRATGDVPKQAGVPIFEFKCVTSRDCDVFFAASTEKGAKTPPQGFELDAVDSKALSALFKTSDRVFKTINTGPPLKNAVIARPSGLLVDCTNKSKCTVTPIVFSASQGT
jgi:hypothetical protein